MLTYSALTTVSGRAKAERIGEALERLTPVPTGVGVFDLEDGSGTWEVGGYFTEPPDQTALMLVAAAFDAADFAVSEIPETDWVAHVRRELSPVTAGRFFVHGSHDADKIPDGSVPLLIEAAMAFGTGHHGTTLGCLRLLEKAVNGPQKPARVLDVGCGTAVLAMGAAHVCAGPVIASDIDPVAVDVARANVGANGLEKRVECLLADGLDHELIEAEGPFDLVMANILKAPLMELAPSISAVTAENGQAILSGILNHQADDIVERYRAFGYNLAHQEVIVDWTALLLVKTRLSRAKLGLS